MPRHALTSVRGVGPYLAKNVLDTLVLHGMVDFDLGVVGPGSIASISYLRGGSNSMNRAGYWPSDPAGENDRQTVAMLASTEGCHWMDMQSALCFWRRSA
jgi:hypothetical protein